QGVIIFSQGLGNETIVGWIINCREQDPIHPQETRFLVEFVLDTGPHGDLNDSGKLRGQILSRRYIVPSVGHHLCSAVPEVPSGSRPGNPRKLAKPEQSSSLPSANRKSINPAGNLPGASMLGLDPFSGPTYP